MKCAFEPLWANQVEYEKALSFQSECHAAVLSGRTNRILGLEHPTTITLGARSDRALDLVKSNDSYHGINIVSVDRGGEATLHSPGQVVIYPFVRLSDLNMGPKDFVHLLEETTIKCLREFGIEAHRSGNEPGLYTRTGKIAFFGLRIDRGVSRHGLAINVANDTRLFSLIRSCGKSQETFDSVENYNSDVIPSAVFSKWCNVLALC